MIRATVAVALGLVAVVPAQSQTLPVTTPESVGMSSTRLKLVGEALEREIAEDQLPGAVIAIARYGEVPFYESFGYLNKQEGIRMPRDAIFSIWSMTKPIVAVGALMLHEQGLLGLDEPVGTYLPELADRRVAIGENPSNTVPARRQPTAGIGGRPSGCSRQNRPTIAFNPTTRSLWTLRAAPILRRFGLR